jgi:hypothetical protein
LTNHNHGYKIKIEYCSLQFKEQPRLQQGKRRMKDSQKTDQLEVIAKFSSYFSRHIFVQFSPAKNSRQIFSRQIFHPNFSRNHFT